MIADLFILSSSYRCEADKTYVQLWCRDKHGRKVLVEDQMDPFLEIRGLTPGHISMLERDKKVKRVEPITRRMRRGNEVRMHRVYTRYPYDVPVIRRNTPKYMGVYRGDIVYPLNYMMIKGMGPYIRVIGEPEKLTDGGLLFSSPRIGKRAKRFKPRPRIMTYDLEKLLRDGQEIVVIGVYYEEKKWAFVLDEEGQVDEAKVEGEMVSFSSEKEMIKGFYQFLIEQDPDILVSYNGDNYDWPKLVGRGEKYGIQPRIGRDNGKIRFHSSKNKQGNTRTSVEIRGRISWDLYKSVQKFLDLKRERLKDVLEHYDLPSKMDLDAVKIDEHWARDKEQVINYCINDAYVTHLAFLKSRFMDRAVSLADTTNLPIAEVTEATSSRMVDSTMIREYDSEDYAIPLNRRTKGKKKKIQGAFVYPMTAGLYRWVTSIDVKCFSEDTELLTEDGWKGIDEISLEDRFASLNMEEDKFEFVPAEHRYEYDYDGKMIEIEGVGISQLVTPNHRVIYHQRNRDKNRNKTGIKGNETYWKSEYKVERADSIPDFISIPHFPKWKPEREIGGVEIAGKHFDMDNFLPWLGLYLSEGHGYEHSLVVSQCIEENLPIFDNIYNNLGIDYKVSNSERKKEFIIDGRKCNRHHRIERSYFINDWGFVKEVVDEHGHDSFDMRVGRGLLNRLTSQQADLLLEYLTLGDGHKTDQLWTYYTRSKELSEDVQELALKAGYSASISMNIIRDKPFYMVGISRKRKNTIRKCRGHIKEVDYHGRVFCVSNKNTTLVTRRKGKVSVSGNSMYPSQIIKHNICWTTICDDETDRTHAHPISYVVTEKDDKGNIVDTYEKTHWFYDADCKKGILPRIMENLMKRRADAKKKMREAQTEDEREYFDGLQGSLKILLNSFYGIMASYFYRFTDKRIGESITGASQNEILNAIDYVEEMGHPVVAADTDSVYFLSGEETLDGAVEVMSKIADDLSDGPIVMEPEKVWRTWFNHGKKKRYAGIIVWKDGEKLSEPQTKIMGYQTQRTDTCNLENKEVRQILEAIINEENMDKYLRKLQKRLFEMPYDKEDYIFSSSVKSEEDYKNPSSQAQFRCAEMMREKGAEVFPGQRVSWVVTDGSKSPIVIEPVMNNKIPEPDKEYYRQRVIHSLAGDSKDPKITMVFGWDDKSLKTGKKITRLDDYFLVGE